MVANENQNLCEWVSVNGTRMPSEVTGNGPMLVLVHGGWADHRIWRDVRPALQRDFTVFAFTLRGFGPWDWTDDAFGLDAHSEDVIRIIDYLGAPVHLAGWSYSGHALLAAAAARPTMVRSVMDYEPSLGHLLGRSEQDAEALEEQITGLAPTEELFGNGDREASIRAGIEFLFGLEPGEFADLPSVAQRVFLDNVHTVPKHINAPEPKPLDAEQLSNIACPVLLMEGGNTLSVYRRSIQAVVDLKHDVQTREIPGRGHGCTGPKRIR
jgi:pimeloyl-ACP methyl ester carboxylesterase